MEEYKLLSATYVIKMNKYHLLLRFFFHLGNLESHVGWVVFKGK